MEKFSFLKLLKMSDIVEILEKNNLRLKLDVPQPLSRGLDEDGEYRIIAKCEHIKNDEHTEDFSGYMGGALLRNLGYFGAVFGGANNYSAYNGDEIIEIRDFYMTEVLSLKPEKEAQEHVNKMTEEYHKYMTEKFGDMYTQKAKKYFAKLRRQDKKQNEDFQKNM